MQDRLEEVDLAEVIFDMSVSLDGFAKASNATPEQPLGHGGELKAEPGGELQVVGSLNLVRLLLDNDLVDEITLLTYPVVVGQGRRLFPDTGPDLALELVESRATAGGVIFQVYRTAGRPRYG